MKTADFRALTLEEAVARLKEPAPTLICFHTRPDGDAVGSAFALSLWLGAMGSRCYCVSSDEVPQYLSFLSEGLQESVLPESIPTGFENARIVTVDTASPAQMGSLFERFGERVCLMIDHHGMGTPYADHLVVPQAAACGEVVFDLIAASGVDVPARASELLYAAISSDTGCFRYSNVNENTHLHAAALVAQGIDTAEINRRLFETRSYQGLKAEKAGFDRLRFFEDGKIAIITFPYALQRELDVREEHLGTLIDVARCVAGVEVAVAIRGTAKGDFRVSLRSNIDFDVAAVAARLGGGGHVRAAGVTVSADSIEAAQEKILQALCLARSGGANV